MYDVSAAKVSYSAPDILAVILLGTIGGVFGSLYNYLVDKVLRTYSIINEYVPYSTMDRSISKPNLNSEAEKGFKFNQVGPTDH